MVNSGAEFVSAISGRDEFTIIGVGDVVNVAFPCISQDYIKSDNLSTEKSPPLAKILQ